MVQSQERQRRQAWLDQIARRAEELLKDSPNPQREMLWAESRLSEANLFPGNLGTRTPPATWTEQAIAQNRDLMDESLPYLQEKGSHPEEAETFEGLILALIPSEGGL